MWLINNFPKNKFMSKIIVPNSDKSHLWNYWNRVQSPTPDLPNLGTWDRAAIQEFKTDCKLLQVILMYRQVWEPLA